MNLNSWTLRHVPWLITCFVAVTASAPQALCQVIPKSRCVLIDTDAGLDDLRAIALLASSGRPLIVVTTGGLTTAEQGYSAMTEYFRLAKFEPLAIYKGEDSARPFTPGWLAAERARDATLNGYLHAAPPTPKPELLRSSLLKIRGECTAFDVVILAPLTSARLYLPALGQTAQRIVIEGHPLSEGSSFNCSYDVEACQVPFPSFAVSRLEFTDVSGGSYEFHPEQTLVDAFSGPNFGDLLKGIHLATTASWRDQSSVYLWDDVAALRLLNLCSFSRVAGHLVPSVSPRELMHDEALAIR